MEPLNWYINEHKVIKLDVADDIESKIIIRLIFPDTQSSVN